MPAAGRRALSAVLLCGALILLQASPSALSAWDPPSQPRLQPRGAIRQAPGHRAMPPEPGETLPDRPATPPSPPTEAPEFIGSDSCLDCHGNVNHAYLDTAMGRRFTFNPQTDLEKRNCESCHGPGSWHAEEPAVKEWMISFRAENPASVKRENAACLQCHENRTHQYWQGSSHENRGVACTACHVVMEARSPRAALAKPTEMETCASCHQVRKSQMFRNFHMPVREGHMNCSSCHNPHGTPTPSLLKGNSPNDTCYSCHADKRGPFLWEHAPVPENCMNCHDPHGGTREKMLKVSVPRLCQQCHNESSHPTNAQLPSGRFVIGRACNQCHQEIHGSNHPSGFTYSR